MYGVRRATKQCPPRHKTLYTDAIFALDETQQLDDWRRAMTQSGTKSTADRDREVVQKSDISSSPTSHSLHALLGDGLR